MNAGVTSRDIIFGSAAVAAAGALPVAVEAPATRTLFGCLALADHYGRPRWRHPVLPLHKGVSLTGRLGASIGPVTEGPLPVYALPFSDIDPHDESFARAGAIDLCDRFEKAAHRHQSGARYFKANGYSVNHWL